MAQELLGSLTSRIHVTMDIKQNMQGLFSFGEFGSKSIGTLSLFDSLDLEDSETRGSEFSSVLESINEGCNIDDIDDASESQLFPSTPSIISFTGANSEPYSLSSSEFCKIYKAEEVAHNSFTLDILESPKLSQDIQDKNKSEDSISQDSELLGVYSTETATPDTNIKAPKLSNLELIDQDTKTIKSDSQASNKFENFGSNPSVSDEFEDTSSFEQSIKLEQTSIALAPNNTATSKQVLDHPIIAQLIDTLSLGSESVATNTIKLITKTKTQFHNSDIAPSRQINFFDNLEGKEAAGNNGFHSVVPSEKQDIAHNKEEDESITIDKKAADTNINKIEEITIAKTVMKEKPVLQKQYDSAQTLESIKFNLSHSVVNDKRTIKFVLKPKELGRIEIKFENFDTKIDGINATSNNRPNVAITVESKEALNLLHTIKGEIEAAISSKLGSESNFSLELSMGDSNKNGSNYGDQSNKNSELGFNDEESYLADTQYTGEITLTDSGNINLVI